MKRKEIRAWEDSKDPQVGGQRPSTYNFKWGNYENKTFYTFL